jgi:hypothetical protein
MVQGQGQEEAHQGVGEVEKMVEEEVRYLGGELGVRVQKFKSTFHLWGRKA